MNWWKNAGIRRRVLIGTGLVGALAVCAVLAMPWLRTLYDPALRQRFTQWIDSLGLWGGVVMMGVQILQIVVAFLPGEPLELVAGALYGGLGGLLFCLGGCVLGSAAAFLLARRFGQPLLKRFFHEKTLARFSFLQDSRKLETVTFLLFLIPGTPKDALTYLAGTTPIPLLRFLALATFARIPSVITSTYIGSTALTGKWYLTLLLLGVTAAMGLAGILLRDRVMAFCHSHSRHARARDKGSGPS